MLVPFVLLLTNGNKQTTQMFLSLRLTSEKKVNVLVASKSENVHAGNLIKVLAPIVSGRGGGKPDMAMAGGSDANSIQDLLSAVAEQF